jgi:hypothetical protein
VSLRPTLKRLQCVLLGCFPLRQLTRNGSWFRITPRTLYAFIALVHVPQLFQGRHVGIYKRKKNAITILTSLMKDLRFSQPCLWRVISSEIQRCVVPVFCRNMSPSSSGLKINASRIPALLRLTFKELHCVISQKIELLKLNGNWLLYSN